MIPRIASGGSGFSVSNTTTSPEFEPVQVLGERYSKYIDQAQQ